MRLLPRVSASPSAMRCCSLVENAPRLPMKHTRMPFLCSSRTSLPKAPRNSSMRRLTSFSGRLQFSLLKVNRVRAPTSRVAQCSMISRAVSSPALWPAVRSKPRAFAHRPLPSIMMAMWAGVALGVALMLDRVAPRPADGLKARVRSDLQELRLFRREDLVNVGDVLVGELLDFVLRAALLVLGDLAVLEQGFELRVGVAAHAAHGPPSGFRLLARHLDDLLAPLLGERGHAYADHVARGGRHQAEIGSHDGLLDHRDHGFLPGRDGERAAVTQRHVGYLVERHLGAVVLHPQVVEHGGVGAASAQLGERVLKGIGAFVHARGSGFLDVVDHCFSPLSTSVPTLVSPMTMRIKSPARERSNTRRGMPLSRHSTMAVASMTMSLSAMMRS